MDSSLIPEPADDEPQGPGARPPAEVQPTTPIEPPRQADAPPAGFGDTAPPPVPAPPPPPPPPAPPGAATSAYAAPPPVTGRVPDGFANPSAPPAQWTRPATQSSSDGLSIAALVLGLVGLPVSFCLGFFVLPIVVPAAAIVCGIMGRNRATAEGRPTGMALAGLILGIIGVVISVGYIVLFVIAALAGSAAPTTPTRF